MVAAGCLLLGRIRMKIASRSKMIGGGRGHAAPCPGKTLSQRQRHEPQFITVELLHCLAHAKALLHQRSCL